MSRPSATKVARRNVDIEREFGNNLVTWGAVGNLYGGPQLLYSMRKFMYIINILTFFSRASACTLLNLN